MLNCSLRVQKGVSLVELMVGIAVGLVVLAGVTKLFTDYLNSNRRMLIATRLNQELRSVADLVARDLRRAGYWANAKAGVTSGTGEGVTNDYAAVSISGTGIDFRYSTDVDDVASDSEKFTFRLQGGVMQMSKDNGVSWIDLTDSTATTVTSFSVTQVTHSSIPLSEFCFGSGTPPTPPNLNIREYQISISGTSAADPSIARDITESVRVRADQITGSCT